MVLKSLLLVFSFLCITVSSTPAKHGPKPRRTNILVTNDDGWAEAQIRSEFDTLAAVEQFDVILSCPAVDKSGTGNTTATPTTLTTPCDFDSCPVGSPPTGFDPSDPRLNYVNAFPVDAVTFGIEALAPKFFHGTPDFVVSGSNVGNNLGPSGTVNSGTCHAAAQAVKLGVPGVAISGSTAEHVSYTTLTSDPRSPFTIAAEKYNALTLRIVETLLAPSNTNNGHNGKSAILPPGAFVNINYPPTNATFCPDVKDFRYIFTRLAPAVKGETHDVELCHNNGVLTDEVTAIQKPGGCWVTLSVVGAVTFRDVDAETQAIVAEKLKQILSCQ